MINTFTYSTNSPLNVSTYDHMINILTAIKEGQEVQYRDEDMGEWTLHDINELPRFVNYEYRIKPASNKYRVGLFMTKNGYHTLTVSSDGTADLREHNDPTFVKWLTDWVEYEV